MSHGNREDRGKGFKERQEDVSSIIVPHRSVAKLLSQASMFAATFAGHSRPIIVVPFYSRAHTLSLSIRFVRSTPSDALDLGFEAHDLTFEVASLRGPFIWGRLRLGHDLGVGRYGGRVATGSLAILGWTLENHMPFYLTKEKKPFAILCRRRDIGDGVWIKRGAQVGAAQARVHALHASDEDGGGARGRNRVKGEAKEKHFLDAIRVSVMVIEPEVNHFHFSNFQLYNLIAFFKKFILEILSNSVPIAG